jgi:hypothetical protein
MSKKVGNEHLLGLWLEWAVLNKTAKRRDTLALLTMEHLFPRRSEKVKKGGLKALCALLNDTAG